MCLVCLVFLVCVVVSLKIKWSSTASSGKANDWRTRERAVFDSFSHVSFGEFSKARDNSTWAVSWLAELTVTLLPSPSFPPSPPCVRPKNLCV